MEDEIDLWSFCRDVLHRGAAIYSDTEAMRRTYEHHSAVMDGAAREFAARLRQHIAAAVRKATEEKKVS